MTDLPDSLHNPSKDPARLAADLLHHYSFELAGYPLVQQIEIWLEYYPAQWLPLAIIEALYQGRYKAISVEQILNLWERRDHPVYHFNHEFERLICGNLPQPPHSEPKDSFGTSKSVSSNPALSYRKMLLELPSIQAASKLERLSEIPSLKLALNRSETSFVNNAPPSQQIPEPPAYTDTGATAASSASNGKDVDATPIAASPELPLARDREFQEFKEGVVFGLSSGLSATILKPRIRLVLSQHYRPNWMAFLEPPAAIAPFTPEPTASDRNSLPT